jgi:hypothetical protein
MNLSYCLLILGLAIGGLNLHSARTQHPPGGHAAVAWPTEFEGRPLEPLPLSEMESSFAASFPGAIAHFQCGDEQVILRHVERGTRKLHSSATCLKAAGFQIADQANASRHGSAWLAYRATRGHGTLQVREQIRSLHDNDATWTDVSQWFWHATIHPDRGPWLAVTVLRNGAQ